MVAAVIDLSTVRHVARLARLRLEPVEEARMGQELSAILEAVAVIQDLDLDEVPPTTHVIAMDNVMRDDVPRPGLSQAEALRTFFRKNLGFHSTDVGGGWLIFDAPEADLGVHPTEGPEPPSGTAHVSFYCDNLEQTVAEMKQNGVEFTQPIEDHGYGLVTFFKVPGDFTVQLAEVTVVLEVKEEAVKL